MKYTYFIKKIQTNYHRSNLFLDDKTGLDS